MSASAIDARGMTTLVYGLALTGEAVVAELCRRGDEVLVADDAADEASVDAKRRRAAELGARWIERPATAAADAVDQMLDGVDRLCPAPGVPETHPVIVAAERRRVPIRTEIDLAYEFEQHRPGGPRPILAVTGTDGKTTTTELATHLLRRAGRRAVAVGNTEVPFLAELGGDAEVFVVECSSFRLNWLDSFRAEASVWLNLAPDHQNWHRSLAAYRAAKARMWSHVRPTDVAIGALDEAEVLDELARVACRRVTFGLHAHGRTVPDYRLAGTTLVGPHGPIIDRASMSRDLPHDVSNALAACALVVESGLLATDQLAAGLADFRHPDHRIQLVGEADGVRWYNDSKATSPHAVLPAIRSFPSVVLIAGGRNKGLDLGELAGAAGHVHAVVAVGEAAAEVAAAFAGTCPVTTVTAPTRAGMAEAVDAAAALARPGDVVLLSPGCASFDWYPEGGYPARGRDFARLVTDRLQRSGAGR